MTKEIVAEILCSCPELLGEIGLHDKNHQVTVIRKILFCFLSVKGKHLCKNANLEENSLIRHKKIKEVLFKHE